MPTIVGSSEKDGHHQLARIDAEVKDSKFQLNVVQCIVVVWGKGRGGHGISRLFKNFLTFQLQVVQVNK